MNNVLFDLPSVSCSFFISFELFKFLWRCIGRPYRLLPMAPNCLGTALTLCDVTLLSPFYVWLSERASDQHFWAIILFMSVIRALPILVFADTDFFWPIRVPIFPITEFFWSIISTENYKHDPLSIFWLCKTFSSAHTHTIFCDGRI